MSRTTAGYVAIRHTSEVGHSSEELERFINQKNLENFLEITEKLVYEEVLGGVEVKIFELNL